MRGERGTTAAAVVAGVIAVLGVSVPVGIRLFVDQMGEGRSASRAQAERLLEEQARTFADTVREQPAMPSDEQLAELGRPLDVQLVKIRRGPGLDLVMVSKLSWSTGGTGSELMRRCFQLSTAGFGTPSARGDLLPLTGCPTGTP